jgi:hypothetical protein
MLQEDDQHGTSVRRSLLLEVFALRFMGWKGMRVSWFTSTGE